MDPMLVIANAAAGGSDDDLEIAVSLLREHADVEVCQTNDHGELDGALHRAGSRTVVVAGGDGSLHAVMTALHRRHELDKQPIGLLPLGTGNDFARSTDIPLDPEEAALALIKGAPQPMDLILDELGGVVVNNVHVGASASASRHGATWKERLGPLGLGIIGYPVGALLSVVRPESVRLCIEVDGEAVVDMDQPVLMVAIGNGRTVGGGAAVNPEADPQSGSLDVVISLATSPVARVGYAAAMLARRHQERSDVLHVTANQVTISGEDFWLSADGEISGPETRRAWHVEPAAYSLIVV